MEQKIMLMTVVMMSASNVYAAEEPLKVPKEAKGQMTLEQRRTALFAQAQDADMQLRGGSFYLSSREIDDINAQAAESPGNTAPTFGADRKKKR